MLVFFFFFFFHSDEIHDGYNTVEKNTIEKHYTLNTLWFYFVVCLFHSNTVMVNDSYDMTSVLNVQTWFQTRGSARAHTQSCMTCCWPPLGGRKSSFLTRYKICLHYDRHFLAAVAREMTEILLWITSFTPLNSPETAWVSWFTVLLSICASQQLCIASIVFAFCYYPHVR